MFTVITSNPIASYVLVPKLKGKEFNNRQRKCYVSMEATRAETNTGSKKAVTGMMMREGIEMLLPIEAVPREVHSRQIL